MIRWSVGIEAEGDRVMALAEIVELAPVVRVEAVSESEDAADGDDG